MITMPDGTIKQTNPITGRKAWSVPGRARRPIANGIQKELKEIERKERENYCNFCEAHYLNTPPEKARLIFAENGYRLLSQVAAEDLFKTTALFRRVPNLFEIVTVDYWEKNYNYRLSPQNALWKKLYLSTEEGRRHVLNAIKTKLQLLGLNPEEIEARREEEKFDLADAFFGGSHELIVARRHYREDAKYDFQFCSSGDLTQEEHAQYFLFTTLALQDICANNRYVRYVAVFQNWLRDAGASFDHLHKQLVGLDEWGIAIEREVAQIRENPNMYNQLAVNFAAYQNRVIAENDSAIAFADIGHRFPTLAIYSKSHHLRPFEQTQQEIRDFSNIVHGLHTALGSTIPCNEEWFYCPKDCLDKIPWHVLLELRISTEAGFEGGTRLHINPISPFELRDQIVPRLYELRDHRIVGGFRIAEECPVETNPLRYNG
ncbi:MAG: DUF4921 family protein [Candidatus Tectomicrobia bacterium]|nr:DUF4921 family protein [Candidatus Tectomicrobia bacterium]